MGVLTNFRDRLAYKKEFKESLKAQGLKVDPKIVKKCVDIAMAMNNIFAMTEKARGLEVDENSVEYVNAFINANMAALIKTVNTAKSDDSYIG